LLLAYGDAASNGYMKKKSTQGNIINYGWDLSVKAGVAELPTLGLALGIEVLRDRGVGSGYSGYDS